MSEGVGTIKSSGQSRAFTDSPVEQTLSKVEEVRNQAGPMFDQVSDRAQRLVQQGREALHDTTQMIKERATQASEQAVGYTKDEPVKAMFIAAAVGALLMGLVTLMARSRH